MATTQRSITGSENPKEVSAASCRRWIYKRLGGKMAPIRCFVPRRCIPQGKFGKKMMGQENVWATHTRPKHFLARHFLANFQVLHPGKTAFIKNRNNIPKENLRSESSFMRV